MVVSCYDATFTLMFSFASMMLYIFTYLRSNVKKADFVNQQVLSHLLSLIYVDLVLQNVESPTQRLPDHLGLKVLCSIYSL